MKAGKMLPVLGLIMLVVGLACGKISRPVTTKLPELKAASTHTAESLPTTEEPGATENETIPTVIFNPIYHGDFFTVINVNIRKTLPLRAAAGLSQAVIATIPPFGVNIQTVGLEQQVDGVSWVPILYENDLGWVEKQYLTQQIGTADELVASQALSIIQAIQQIDSDTIAQFVHPDKGLRFTPYAFSSPQDLVFSSNQVSSLPADPKKYQWGHFDGTGAPIELTFIEYFNQFIYDAEFIQPDIIGFDVRVGKGNAINNISEFYPNAVFVEYHFTGFDPDYGGMDWRSLRIVLEEQDGVWYLVGIIHDQWTI
ncbi:MAG: hypothetical protein IZT55_06895 [Anaerolineae bacterium]|nr:hypothetical protein [Anaerolineae bacterium]